MGKQYDTDNYHCAHFVVDVYRSMYGNDMAEALSCFLFPVDKARADIGIRKKFQRVHKGKTGDILVLHHFTGETHVGIFYKDKVMHLSREGVIMAYIEYVKLGFKRGRIYRYVGSGSCL